MSIVISYIQPFEADTASFGAMRNVELSAKDLLRALNQARQHLVTRVIPRGGRAIQAMRTSTEDRILDKHVKQDDGHFVNEKVLCDCGAHFVADKHGEYVCDKCGIINAFEDNFIVETPEEDEEPLEDEDNFEEPSEDHHETYEPTNAYMKAKDGAVAIEARLAEHQAAWKANLTERPEDEKYAKFLARERKDRHNAVVKANRSRSQRVLYENKWAEARRQYNAFRVISAIKNGMTDIGALRTTMNMSNKSFYSTLETLEAKGRITRVKTDKRTVLTYVART